MKKQLISIIMIMVMLTTFSQLGSFAEVITSDINQYDFTDVTIHYGAQDSPVPQNKCGENVYWEFDASTATLTISGSGAMDEYNPLVHTAPWEAYQESIEHLVVSEGVTYFSGGTIATGHTALKTITFPESLTGYISYISLGNFPNLTDVFYAGNMTEFYALFGGYLEIPNNVTVHYGEAAQDPTPSADVYYTENIPESIKVGDLMPKADITYHNLTSGIEYYTYITDFSGENESDPVFYYHPYDRSEGSSTIVAEDGTLKNQEWASDEQVSAVYAYRPGYWRLTPQISAAQPPYGQWQIGNPIYVQVEEPIITHTAPAAAIVGETIQFKTALTNVNLTNQKISAYQNIEPTICYTDEQWYPDGVSYTHQSHSFGNLHPIAYEPNVEIISGFDLIERENKDYSNTLHSTESIKFLAEGTVVIKISYNQIKTMTCANECYNYSKTVAITITEADAKWEGAFTDVNSQAYYYEPVLWASNLGITTGTSANTFSPGNACTRGQIVTFLWRAAGSPIPQSSNNPFSDVKTDAYYYNAVLWAVENGITSGTSSTTFSPGAVCSRGQIVTFLWRAAGSPTPQSSNNPFGDVKTDAYYYNAVLWAVENGITSGTSSTTFSPGSSCTRGQIVTFLYRYYH